MCQPACKKSGEIIKSALRSSRSTATTSKKVHFNKNLTQIWHFSQGQSNSIAANTGPINESDSPFRSQPKPSEWEVIATNFAQNSAGRQNLFARVEQLRLSEDCQNLIGAIAVANIAFEKYIAARFTFDNWQTISEVTAEYKNTQKEPPVDRYDQFEFAIKIPDHANLQGKTLILCVRYQVNGQEYWDNNLGENFHLKFARNLPLKAHPASTQALSQRNPYDFKTSLHEATNRYPSGGQPIYGSLQLETPNTIELASVTQSPVALFAQNRSIADLNSTTYRDLIDKFCYFKPDHGIMKPGFAFGVFPKPYQRAEETKTIASF